MYFRKYRLMNEASELDGGGDTDAFAESSFSDNSRSIEPDFHDTMKDMGLNASDFGLDDDEPETLNEESQGSDESQNAGQATDENAWLEKVNSLGAIHGESPIKIETPEQLKEYLQKAQDYTVKTQSLSEERKAFESNKVETEKELNAAIQEFNTKVQENDKQLQELQQWVFTLNKLRDDAPDIHEELVRAHAGTVEKYSNPVIDQQFAAQNKRFEELEKKLISRENEVIIDKFEMEKQALFATEQSLKELGINVDWDKVKNDYFATGLSAKQVMGSIYLDSLTKAQASKQKVETTKQKVSAKPIGAAGSSRPGVKNPQISRKLSAFEYAQEYLKQIS